MLSSRVLIRGLIALVLVFAAGQAVHAGWVTSQLLNDPSEPSTKNAKLYASKYGGFHAVYSNCSSPWQAVYRRYNNGYLTPKLVVRYGFVPNTNVCEAGNGDIHLVWEDWDTPLEIGWAKSSDGGQTFSWQEISNTNDTKWPQIVPYGAADSPSVMMSYWQAEWKDLLWRSYDGSSWGTLNFMGQSADNQYSVCGTCRSLQDGTVYRTYSTSVGGVLSICYKRYNGSHWEPQVVVASPGFMCRQDIAVNPTGHILVMWEKDERLWTRMYTPGVGWGAVEQRTDMKSGFAGVTSIPGTTDFYMVYCNGQANQIYGMRWQGGVWQAPELVSVGLPGAMVVDSEVCAGPNGTLYASWEHWGTDNCQQYFSIREGNPPPDATAQGFVRDQYGQGIVGASVGSGAYVTVSLVGGAYSFGVPSGTRAFSANKDGYTGQTIDSVIVPPGGTVNRDFVITAVHPSPPGGFAAMPSDGLIRLAWTNPANTYFQGTLIRYKTTGYPTGPTDGTLLCNRATISGAPDSFIHSPVTNGTTYYYAAFAHDSDNHFSNAAQASATPLRATCSFVRQLPDDWLVDMNSKVVTADFTATDGCIYIEESDRSSGLRVATTQTGLVPGDRVNVSGRMSTRVLSGYSSERVILDAVVNEVSSGDAPRPVAMACRAVGGGPAGPMVAGVMNGVGLNNVGLLVKIAGKVTYKNGNYIYVDDGSHVKNLYGLFAEKTGVMVRCPGIPDASEQDTVVVTGIVEGSIPNNPDWTTNRAYVHLRDWSDFSAFNATPTTGGISGTITAGGVGLGGATVSTSPGGYFATTNTDGTYSVTNVPPGTYTVTASKSGYVSANQPNLVVSAGMTATSNLTLTVAPGTISGTVTTQGGGVLSGALVSTSSGGYSTTTDTNGRYLLSGVTAGAYIVTASRTGHNPDTKTGIQVSAGGATTVNFTLSLAGLTERVTNGDFEGGFHNSGWAATCGGHTSQIPNPSTSGWGWNNDTSYPFNTWDSSGIKHGGTHALGFCFCQTAGSPGKMGIAYQTVYIGAAGATATFSAWGYHTNGNCPTIMCWNPGIGQNNPGVANSNGRYQWITTDNWGKLNTWVNRTMTVTSDSSGYVTIMVGGAAHTGTSNGAALYIDDVSVIGAGM